MDYIDIADDEDSLFDDIAWSVAGKLGFATPIPPGHEVPVQRRIGRCNARVRAALTAVGDIQQWLVDDNPDVRTAAREGVRQVLYSAYAGDQNEYSWSLPASPAGLDRLMFRFLHRRVSPDGAAPWWDSPKRQRLVRKVLIGAAFVLAACAGVALGARHPLVALPLLSAAGIVDLLDGAFARTVRMRDARLRWRSCISSHAGDLMMLLGAAAAEAAATTEGVAAWIVIAMTLSLFASFTRTSALQAGYRFWRSRRERWARYVSLSWFAVWIAAGYPRFAAGGLAVALILVSALEIAKVGFKVERMPQVLGSGILFAFESDTPASGTVHAWGLADTWESSWTSSEPTRLGRSDTERQAVTPS